METSVTRRIGVALAVITTTFSTLIPVALANHQAPQNGTIHDYGDMVDYDLTFPVAGSTTYVDSFFAARGSGIHHGTDIMADKMTPVVAAADGVISAYNGSGNPNWTGRCCSLHVTHDDGWKSVYIHLNNDTPGTDDGQGWGIADGINLGDRVRAGQVIGYVGDSGNAEGTAPHLHFELYDTEGIAVNAYNALRVAEGKAPIVVCQPPNPGSLDALLKGSDIIKSGSTGQAVKQLQRFLAALGYSPGPVDGVLGSRTADALRSFQRGRGINPDGVVGPTTRSHIKSVATAMPALPVLATSGRVIRPGYRGSDVKDLQQLLSLAGYDPGPLDGIYGGRTESAVAAFQSSSGLTVDGKVGPGTRRALADRLGLGDYQACS